MSQIGGPIQSGLAGGVPAQETASKARAKRDREQSEKTRRFEDAFDLTVAGVENADAVRRLDEHDEEHRQREKRKADQKAAAEERSAPPPREDGPHIDLRG